MADAPPESSVQTIGRTLYRRARAHPPGFYAGRRWVLKRAIADARLRDALFQFIDVLPQLRDAAMIAAHFRAYLGGFELGGLFGRTLRLGGQRWMAPLLRQAVARMARLFMVEEDAAALSASLKTMARLPATVSLDALGEAVLSEAEADIYVARILKLLAWLAASPTQQPDLSIKLSALTPRFDPIDLEGSVARVLGRLEPIRAAAAQAGSASRSTWKTTTAGRWCWRCSGVWRNGPASRPGSRCKPIARTPKRTCTACSNCRGRPSGRCACAWLRAPTGTAKWHWPRSASGPARCIPTRPPPTPASSGSAQCCSRRASASIR